MTVRIYTANYGGRDRAFAQVAQDIDVEWLYFTDRAGDVPAPWTVMRQDTNPLLHPNMEAKWHKTHPPFAEDWNERDRCIWLDASMEVTSSAFARQAIGALDERPLAVWAHPRRSSIADEVEASLGAESQGGRYAALPMREQVAAYLAEGYPDEALYACGTVVWTPEATALGAAWWEECVRWGYQDQLSFPVVCWRFGVRPAVFSGSQVEQRARWRNETVLVNRWFAIHPHQPGTD